MMQAWADFLDRLRIANLRSTNQSIENHSLPGTTSLQVKSQRPIGYELPASPVVKDLSAPMHLTERAVRLALPHSSPRCERGSRSLT